MSPLLQAITFDAAGTLFHTAEPVGQVYSRLARQHGLNLAPDALSRAFRATFGAAPPLHASPAGDPGAAAAAERAWWKDLVDATFREARGGAAPSVPGALFLGLWDHYARPEAWTLYPEVPAALERLSRRLPLAVISNFDARFHGIAEGLGLAPWFQAVILSGEVGQAKPAPALFHAASAALGIAAERIIHAGDDPEADWRGARDAGMQAYELRRPENSLAGLLA